MALFKPSNIDNDETQQRTVLVDKKTHDWMFSTDGNKETRQAKLQAQQALKTFWKGGHIRCGAYMKRTNRSKRIWHIRGLREPPIRLLGAFAGPDIFVVVQKRYRRLMPKKKDWRPVVDAAVRCWDKILPGLERFHSDYFEEYVTFKGEGEIHDEEENS